MNEYIVERKVIMTQTLIVKANSKKEARELVSRGHDNESVQVCELECVATMKPFSIEKISV